MRWVAISSTSLLHSQGKNMPDSKPEVSFRYDSPELSPQAVAEEWLRSSFESELKADSYMLGGSVQAFEDAFASYVGKEKAVLIPTGTLANHLAVRSLTRGGGRVLVQERGHLYNDSGDCLQRLSGLNVIPLGRDRATFRLEEVQEAVQMAGASRVRVEVGALVIETPVRRKQGEMFDQGEMQRICDYARGQGIGLHLDGARIFIASAYTGIPVREYAAGFDTIYVSLYKYLGTPCGAVLAGSASLLEGIHHERRMFGGALNQGWMFTASVMSAIEGFQSRFAGVISASEQFKDRLRKTTGLSILDIPNGTNVSRLELPEGYDISGFRMRLGSFGVLLPEPEKNSFHLKMNESILTLPVEDLVERFSRAL